jgi:uridylate kinase
VLLAKTFGVRQIINASNVDYIYTSDPKTNITASALKKISWKEFRKIIGNKWVPGAHLPFDPLAAKEAEQIGLQVVFVRGTQLQQLDSALRGEEVEGTIIV